MSYSKDFFSGVKSEIKEPFTFSIYLKGDKLAYLDGFKSIIRITSDSVELLVQNGRLIISGENLSIEKLEESSLVIAGNIGGVGIER